MVMLKSDLMFNLVFLSVRLNKVDQLHHPRLSCANKTLLLLFISTEPHEVWGYIRNCIDLQKQKGFFFLIGEAFYFTKVYQICCKILFLRSKNCTALENSHKHCRKCYIKTKLKSLALGCFYILMKVWNVFCSAIPRIRPRAAFVCTKMVPC